MKDYSITDWTGIWLRAAAGLALANLICTLPFLFLATLFVMAGGEL